MWLNVIRATRPLYSVVSNFRLDVDVGFVDVDDDSCYFLRSFSLLMYCNYCLSFEVHVEEEANCLLIWGVLVLGEYVEEDLQTQVAVIDALNDDDPESLKGHFSNESSTSPSLRKCYWEFDRFRYASSLYVARLIEFYHVDNKLQQILKRLELEANIQWQWLRLGLSNKPQNRPH